MGYVLVSLGLTLAGAKVVKGMSSLAMEVNLHKIFSLILLYWSV